MAYNLINGLCPERYSSTLIRLPSATNHWCIPIELHRECNVTRQQLGMPVTPTHLPFTLISFLPPPSQDITLKCHSPKVLDLELKYYGFLEFVQSHNLTPVPSNAVSLAAFYYM